MLKLYINNTDQSDYLADNSLSITDQIQNKANTCTFDLNKGATSIEENQDVQIFDCVEIVSYSGSTLIVKDTLRSGLSIFDFDKYRVGEYIWFDVGGTKQERFQIVSIAPYTTAGQVQIVVDDTLPETSHVVDTYSEVNYVTAGIVRNDNIKAYGQGMTGDGSTISSAKFYLRRTGSPTGSCYARLYASSGTFGVNAKPTGSALAVSDAYDVASIGSVGRSLKEFTFSGTNRIVIEDGTNYFIVFDMTGTTSDVSNYISIAIDTTSPTHAGNYVTYTSSWISSSTRDLCFYVYGRTVGLLAGKKIFGGTLSSVTKQNPWLLSDVEYKCSGTDYTKIFDKKLINDSWTDADCQYIINDFLNTTINYNHELDDMDYADDAAIQAVWTEASDGNNPTREGTDFIQGTSCANFGWTYSAGTATMTSTITAIDISEYTGIPAGTPIKGYVTFWYKKASSTALTTNLRIGSNSINYASHNLITELDTDWHFVSIPMKLMTITGTPNWVLLAHLKFTFTETATSSILIDDLRVTADGSFTAYNVESTFALEDARASFKKPTIFMQSLANAVAYYWYVDYDKDIHFFDKDNNVAPFSLTDTSDNFNKLVVNVDTSQLKNRQAVRGGTKVSTSLYSQVVEGDNAVREWILKSSFKNLSVYLDDNSSTDTTEAGTTSTTINCTAHGLVDGDYIVNRTRSNAVRQITWVSVDQFTVEAVASQVSGDTFSKFATVKTVGIENLDDETLFDYVSNFGEKSIRATSVTTTLIAGEFLLFTYNEIIPLRKVPA